MSAKASTFGSCNPDSILYKGAAYLRSRTKILGPSQQMHAANDATAHAFAARIYWAFMQLGGPFDSLAKARRNNIERAGLVARGAQDLKGSRAKVGAKFIRLDGVQTPP
jgi:hypothetical protein